MKRILVFVLCVCLFIGCKKRNSQSESFKHTYDYNETEDDTEEVWDGDYCADVEYYNPNTGTHSSYTLTIEVYDNELELINFPNGGYLDDFYNVDFDEDGFAEFTSDKGYDYEVQITGGAAECFEDVDMAVQCNGITNDGDQCQNLTDNYSGYCWQHEDQE